MEPLPSLVPNRGGLWTPGGCELVATCYESAVYGGLCADEIAAEIARRYNAHNALLAACEKAEALRPFVNLPDGRVRCFWCDEKWHPDGGDHHRQSGLVTQLRAAIALAKEDSP